MITKEHFWIDDNYADLFRSASLNNSKNIYREDFGTLVRADAERSIHYFTINTNGSSVGFYLKKDNPSFRSHLKSFLKGRSVYKLKTRHELDLIRLYKSQAVSVVEPVAFCEQCVLGIPIRGFLVQREVVGRELVDMLKQGSVEERIKLAKAYGKFVAGLHSKGLISTVVRTPDLICTSPINMQWQDITFVVIDREKGPLGLEAFSVDKVARALSSVLVRFLIYVDIPSSKEVMGFLRTYVNTLQVDHRPTLRNMFFATRRHFDIMMERYGWRISPADRKLLAATLCTFKDKLTARSAHWSG